MSESSARYRPQLTDAGLKPTHRVVAVDEYGEPREQFIAGERPLTLYLDRREIVTLMTLGGNPEALALGYLRNQGFIGALEQVEAVQVDWEVESAAVTTRPGTELPEVRLDKRTVTTGCGQGTVFGDLMEQLRSIRMPRRRYRQSMIYGLLRALGEYNEIYRAAGAVHGCALCSEDGILYFVEDVGRHNAVDTIAGMMWLDGEQAGADKVFYTTGRLTSEMVIKVAQMGVPLLLSRSGITQMGLALAEQLGVTMIARAKGNHFLIYSGADCVELDSVPLRRT